MYSALHPRTIPVVVEKSENSAAWKPLVEKNKSLCGEALLPTPRNTIPPTNFCTAQAARNGEPFALSHEIAGL
jgi:hypothetical protein